MQLEAELVLELNVEIGEAKEVGMTSEGFLRLIPITGGTFSGKGIKGKVIPGGYDWNVTVNDKLSHLLAKYAIQTDDGDYISVENEGYIDFTQNDFIKTTPRFQVQSEKYAWLQSGVFVGSLMPLDSNVPGVKINVYKLK
ncbi:MAG: hypothetical protein PWQ76_1093 [Clostridiales bacterium]|jgi:hypothetical protein|nr:hypothetical protein [Oscillospiraceae bacterium]MDN5378838.1 hypothetical protein [Clostridiales bacterium]